MRLLDLVASRIAALEFGIARYMGNSGSRVRHTNLQGDASGKRHETYRKVIGKMRDREERIRQTGSLRPLEDRWVVGKGQSDIAMPGPRGFAMVSKPSVKDPNYTTVRRKRSRGGGFLRQPLGAYSGKDYKNPRIIEVVAKASRSGNKITPGAFAEITKTSPRKASFNLIDTPSGLHGTPRNAGALRGLVPVMKHFKKNKVSVTFHPHAMSSSLNKGAVTDTRTLLKGYIGIAKKLGFKHGRLSKGGPGHIFKP